jgi:hypothetical protein
VQYVGDSVLGQAGAVLTALGQQRCHTIRVWAVAGAAPCDVLDGYGAQLANSRPSVVSFAFIGNATSSCMVQRMGWSRPPAHLTPDQVERIGYWYEADLRVLIRWNLAHGLKTLLVLPMQMDSGTWHGQMTDELISRYTRIAHEYRAVDVDDGPRDALTPGGVYRAGITVDGVPVAVRHRDGTHLAAPAGTWTWAAAALIAPTLLTR